MAYNTTSMSSITATRVKEEHKFIVSVKSEYAAGYDPVKDEETDEEEECELLDVCCNHCQPIKNEDDVNVNADDDVTDDESSLGKLISI